MIFVSAKELEDAFHLFTVMNNRGIKLRNSDILKAENLSVIKDDKERILYARLWEEIEDYFKEKFDVFMSHLRTILVKQKAEVNLYKEYEEKIYRAGLLNKGKDTFELLKKYMGYYETMSDPNDAIFKSGLAPYNYIILMGRGFEANYWEAALLRFFDKFKTTKLLDFVKLLDIKFSSDWIAGFSPAKRIENVNKIIQATERYNNADDLLASKEFCIDKDSFKRNILGNIYGKRFEQYVMLKLDLLYHGHSTPFDPPERASVEHILPQHPRSGSTWLTDFSDDDRNKWTDRMGNLVLISKIKNSSQGNKDYADKKTNYFKNRIELFSNSVRVLTSFNSWKKSDLIKNHKDVVKIFCAEYGVAVTDQDMEA
jgi:hypothetical protein